MHPVLFFSFPNASTFVLLYGREQNSMDFNGALNNIFAMILVCFLPFVRYVWILSVDCPWPDILWTTKSIGSVRGPTKNGARIEGGEDRLAGEETTYRRDQQATTSVSIVL